MKDIQPKSINKTDLHILNTLKSKKCLDSFRSLTLKNIAEETNLSLIKVRKSIYTFREMRCVELGLKHGHSNTYYITEDGLEFLIKKVYSTKK